MAGIVTHIVLTDKVFNELFSKFDNKQFVLGTSFADIRYLGVIEREKTHYSGITLRQIQAEEDAFIAGLKFHSLVDKIREDYIISHDIYSRLPKSDYISQAMKVCEDMYIYQKCSSWAQYETYFESPITQEEHFLSDVGAINIWHKIVQLCISKQPTIETARTVFDQLKLSKEVVEEIVALSIELQNSSIISDYTAEFYSSFNTLLQE